MNEFGSLSTVLDRLAPTIEPEEPAWDDVLARAGHLTRTSGRQPHSVGSTRRRKLTAVLVAAAATMVVASALAVAGVSPLSELLDSWRSPGSPGLLDGAYSGTVSGLTPARLDGRWTIGFELSQIDSGFGRGRHGDYVISRDGKRMEKGIFQFGSFGTANLLLTATGGPAKCPDSPIAATYRIRYSRLVLELQPLFDPCSNRRNVLSATFFRR